MRIVSVNAWGGVLVDTLAPWLQQCDADIVCLQEVTRTAGASGWTRFADGERSLPQRADLLADVRAALPRHQPIFLVSDAGPVVDSSGALRRQDFGLATFVAEHLPIVATQSAFVHKRFVDHDVWPADDRPRVASGVRVLDRDRTRFVSVVHCHGLRDAAGKIDTPARLDQARALADLVARTREPGDLTVLCGDLNVLPTSVTFDVLADVGLVDLVGDADTRTSHYAKRVRHAGYLLVSDRSAVRRFEVVAEPEVSDHRALVVDV